MNAHYVYTVIDLCCIVVPFAASFHPKIKFYTAWRYALPVMVVVAALFILWDVIFTQRGIWSFNDRYVTGIHIGNLPLEEVAFFVCIPYSCLFTYYCFDLFMKPLLRQSTVVSLSYVIALFLVAAAGMHKMQLYTSVTFTLLAFLLVKSASSKAKFLPMFYVAFTVNLLPFFISNGILTGTWIMEPVVRYDDHNNLGIRLGSIPLEDVFYGMLLQLANVAGFEYLRGYRLSDKLQTGLQIMSGRGNVAQRAE